MNIGFLVMLFLLTAITGNAQEQSTQELSVVSKVDFNKYAGLWYEIARLPNKFQKQCVEDVTATYTLLDDGRIKVVNCCRKEDGEIDEAEGEAKRLDDDAEDGKLKVRFAPAFLSFLPFVWGNYWIIELAPDYSYAVIGEPDREYLWVLSRTPFVEENVLNDILDQVRKKGYDLTGMIKTKQSGKKD